MATELALSTPSPFIAQRHPLAIRIWHWTSFLVMSASLITVLLASTVFKTGPNISTVQEEVSQKGGQVSHDQAWGVAHAFNDKLWDLHKWLGVGLCVLLLSRLLMEFALKKSDRLAGRVRSVALSGVGRPADKTHFIRIMRSYMVFYVLLGVMALTGLVLAFEDVEALKPIHDAAKQVHSFCQWLMYFFIFIHLAGVILADLTHSRGIVSGMINGGKAAD